MEGEEAEVISSGETGKFGRTLGDVKIGGVSQRHLAYELGVSELWGKYGFDDKSSEEWENYKWYDSDFQTNNTEAYELVASRVSPQEIMGDEEYAMLSEKLRIAKLSFDAVSNGGGNKAHTKRVIQDYMQYSDRLAVAQKRRWYEGAMNSDLSRRMMVKWNDPLSKLELEESARTKSYESSVQVDTSWGAIAKNALKQTYSKAVGPKSANPLDNNYFFGTKGLSTQDTADLDGMIANGEVPAHLAADLYDVYHETGNAAIAIEEINQRAINEDVRELESAVDRKEGIAKSLGTYALPYLVNPTTYVGGAAGVKVGAQLTAKAAPWIQTTVKGALGGLGESVAYTSTTAKQFSNEELIEAWAMDAGAGGVLSWAVHGIAKGIEKAGSKAKADLSGASDLNFEVQKDRQRAVDLGEDLAKDVQKVQDAPDMEKAIEELTTQKVNLDVEDAILPPKPEAPEPEPSPNAMTKGEGKASEDAGAAQNEVVEPTDTRSQEQIEADEELWQTQAVSNVLEHQGKVREAYQRAIKEKGNVFSKTHGAMIKLLGSQEMATKLINSTDSKLSYLGTNILETGVGLGGATQRKASAALIKDSIYTANIGNLQKSYRDNIKAWASNQGHSTYAAWKSAYEGGVANDVAKRFHREVILHQESLQMGRKGTDNPQVLAYVKQLNDLNDNMFEARIRANVKGFDASRRVKNYVPHVWKKQRIEQITKKYGQDVVLELLTKSIESAKAAGKIAPDASTTELAKRQLEWIDGLGTSMDSFDSAPDKISGRGQSRIPMDFTTEHNGLSMLDLIDTDLPSMMDTYTQKAAADVGISDATGGLIRSEGDFEKYLKPEDADGAQMWQDTADMLYGRPTRGGMAPELRMLMDTATFRNMGGIGVAQAAETGSMMQRTVVNYFSSPNVAKKIWQVAGENIEDKGVMAQIRSIAAVNDNMQYINRNSINNIDQAQVDELTNLRAASMAAVDKVTLGAYKSQFGRLLGSLSGVNAVQKAQSRLLQASFSVDVARHFKYGKGSSTEARIADLGLGAKTRDAINKYVEFDADEVPSNFNFEQWDKDALAEFSYAMNREEAQLMPRTMAGELPTYMNKPMWQALVQFKKTPLTFMSKGAQRQLMFGDREAIVGTTLNCMTAGITRYAKFAAAGGVYVALADEGFKQPTMEQMSTEQYVSNFGIIPDLYKTGKSIYEAAQQPTLGGALIEGVSNVPAVDALEVTAKALTGDAGAIKQSTPLNTLPVLNEVLNAVVKNMERE